MEQGWDGLSAVPARSPILAASESRGRSLCAAERGDLRSLLVAPSPVATSAEQSTEIVVPVIRFRPWREGRANLMPLPEGWSLRHQTGGVFPVKI